MGDLQAQNGDYWIWLGEKRALEQWQREHPEDKPVEPLADWSSMQLIDILIDRGHLHQTAQVWQRCSAGLYIEHTYELRELRPDPDDDLAMFMEPFKVGGNGPRGRLKGDIVLGEN